MRPVENLYLLYSVINLSSRRSANDLRIRLPKDIIIPASGGPTSQRVLRFHPLESSLRNSWTPGPRAFTESVEWQLPALARIGRVGEDICFLKKWALELELIGRAQL